MFRPDDVDPSFVPFAVAGVTRAPGSEDSEMRIAVVFAPDEASAEMVAMSTWSAHGAVMAIMSTPV